MATAYPVSTSSAALLTTVGTGPIIVLGWSVTKGAGVCNINLREGTATGKIVAIITCQATSGDTQWFGEEGVVCANPILYGEVAGTTTGLIGSVWIK